MISAPPKDTARCEPSIANLLEVMAAEDPGATAVLAPGRAPLTYGRLYDHVRSVSRTLNALGVGRNDRIAMIVPSGPDMAVAFIAVAASATCAPLNPSYLENELDFYLSDLGAKALIIQAGVDSPARAVAQRRGIAIIELVPHSEAEAGTFALAGENRLPADGGGFAQAEDIALILHTSGTTARPKRVPLTHANLCVSARNIVASLALTRQDRCLNVMPLYHIHGLVAGTVSPLAAGASVICPPSFDPGKFFEWLDEFHPTWYTAAPTLHQAILSHARDHLEIVGRCPLRFVRSTSAALPAPVLSDLERVFAAPVIEAYSMTEAAHQVCSNPLPPRARKLGSVGPATGAAVAIMDDSGNLLAPGTVGEVVIQGPSVTRGYEDNPTANLTSFRDGWFRTGDQGVLDTDGYLYIKGRLKEIINRGGEKISPREVDEVLLAHPAVAQAVTFPLPHSMLGEDVGAAVVLRGEATATEADIRQYAATRLAPFKVPSRVLIVDELPKGSTGKLRRLGLAEQFASLLETRFVPAGTPIEQELVRIWAHVLGVERVGIHDNFFELGGTSLTAVRIFSEIQGLTGRALPLATLLRAPTIREIANVLDQAETGTQWPSLVAIQPNGSRPPLFCMHNLGGNILYYRDLARHLGTDQPFFALQQQGLDGRTGLQTRIEDMAAHYVKEIRAFAPDGPYFLAGHSSGGLIAYEAAMQLTARGQRVALLALIDTFFPSELDTSTRLVDRARFHLSNLMELEPRYAPAYVVQRLESAGGRFSLALGRAFSRVHLRARPQTSHEQGPLPQPEQPQLIDTIMKHNRQVTNAYVPQTYPGRIAIFLGDAPEAFGLLRSRWMPKRLAAGGVDVYKVPGHHGTVLEEPQARILAEKLRDALDQAMASVRNSGSVSAARGALPVPS
jgi:oxalate---CoA ligase